MKLTALLMSLASLLLLFVSVYLGLAVGSFAIELGQWPGLLGFTAQPVETNLALIVWELRLPRVLLAGLVGAGLALAGALMQGLFRNPLADPGLLGVSMGAALAAVIGIVMGQTMTQVLNWSPPELLQTLLMPLAAFTGGFAATLFIWKIARHGGRTEIATMLLAGIAVNALAGAAISGLSYAAGTEELRQILFWNLGSLGRANWSLLSWFSPLIILAGLFALAQGRRLNVMTLGEAEAGHLGVNVAKAQLILVLLTAALVGLAVAVSGVIGFVGLVVPHIVRLILGPDHRRLLPVAAILGAALLILADAAARSVLAPAELPVGILTGLLGGPFFLFLLLRYRRSGYGF